MILWARAASPQRMLPARVRAFIDFAIAYTTAELGSIA
jgi:hypothetical protein